MVGPIVKLLAIYEEAQDFICEGIDRNHKTIGV